jgi:hypothetical protein
MIDEEPGTTLLRPLDVGPPGPVRIDVAKAMRNGARRRKRTGWPRGLAVVAVAATAGTGGTLAVTAINGKPCLPPDPTMPKACTAEWLPAGGHLIAEVVQSDAGGRYQVGMSDGAAGHTATALIWHDGKLVADVRLPGRDAAGMGHQRLRHSDRFRERRFGPRLRHPRRQAASGARHRVAQRHQRRRNARVIGGQVSIVPRDKHSDSDDPIRPILWRCE